MILFQLPQDLRAVLEKEWLDSRLLQLTQKQNEYVTHPEIRPPSLPLYTNQTAQSGNNTLQTEQTIPSLANSTGYAPNQSSSLQGKWLYEPISTICTWYRSGCGFCNLNYQLHQKCLRINKLSLYRSFSYQRILQISNLSRIVDPLSAIIKTSSMPTFMAFTRFECRQQRT